MSILGDPQETQQKPPTTITVPVGNEGNDYAIGDYLNAIDELTAYFYTQRETTGSALADALEMYARHYREVM